MRTKQNFIADKMLVLATSAKVAVAATRVGRCKIVRVLFDFFSFNSVGCFVVCGHDGKLVFNSLAIRDCGNYVAEGLLIKSN